MIEVLKTKVSKSSGPTNTINLSDDVVHVRFYYEGVIETPSVTRDYRTRASMNWVKESGKWVAKTMHFSAASFGDVTVTSASDFED